MAARPARRCARAASPSRQTSSSTASRTASASSAASSGSRSPIAPTTSGSPKCTRHGVSGSPKRTTRTDAHRDHRVAERGDEELGRWDAAARAPPRDAERQGREVAGAQQRAEVARVRADAAELAEQVAQPAGSSMVPTTRSRRPHSWRTATDSAVGSSTPSPRFVTSRAGPSGGRCSAPVTRTGIVRGEERRHEVLELRVGAERVDQVATVEPAAHDVDDVGVLRLVGVAAEAGERREPQPPDASASAARSGAAA